MSLVMQSEYEAPPEVGGPFTRDDLEGMPDDGRRYELVDGVLIVSAAPGLRHQAALVELTVLLRAACPEHLRILIAPFAVSLDDFTELQPDLLVARRDALTERRLPGPPLLAVEILSPSTRHIDLHVKRERFERAGTPSFWIVDPVARPADAQLVVWELGDDKAYREVARVTGDETFVATEPFPVTVRPADLVR